MNFGDHRSHLNGDNRFNVFRLLHFQKLDNKDFKGVKFGILSTQLSVYEKYRP